MGMAGSDVAKDAADIVVTDDNFASILNAIEEGRRMFDNIQKFILHLLAENIAQACTLLIGLAFQDSTGLSAFPLAPVQMHQCRSKWEFSPGRFVSTCCSMDFGWHLCACQASFLSSTASATVISAKAATPPTPRPATPSSEPAPPPLSPSHGLPSSLPER